MRQVRWFVFFLVVAGICSLPRFGQRENEYASGVSDSDLYLEMAGVFNGEQGGFTAAYVAIMPHHYNRPLIPWLAGIIGKHLLGGNLRAAFSLLDILAAAGIALMLMMAIGRHVPVWRYAWLPPLLFLAGFPQLNWGYHILTDTVGLATALFVVLYADWFIVADKRSVLYIIHLVGLFICSALAFLTRETGWLAIVAVGWIIVPALIRFSWATRARLVLIVLVLLAGKLPHSIYEHVHALNTPVLHPATLFLWNPAYWLDVVFKSGICFHIIWLLVVWQVWRRLHGKRIARPPRWMLGWTIASGLYMLAAYVHNDVSVVGYPTRIVYSLFPLIYFTVEDLFESGAVQWRPHFLAALLCVAQFAVGLAGVYLDPGTPSITAPSLLRSIHAGDGGRPGTTQ